LVQVYRNDLDYTFKTDRKLLPKWSQPQRVTERLRNSYKIETLTGTPLPGLYHTRRLRAFIPREGSQLHSAQQTYMQQIQQRDSRGNEEIAPRQGTGTHRDTEEEMMNSGSGGQRAGDDEQMTNIDNEQTKSTDDEHTEDSDDKDMEIEAESTQM